eukprot:GHVL01038941.1.p1 GENE.GHVL01038941.1~~GHVL01038941.1.p1  ORF type:complete len:184 (-),score=47.37 GHVL01038941.1:565-1041(-)
MSTSDNIKKQIGILQETLPDLTNDKKNETIKQIEELTKKLKNEFDIIDKIDPVYIEEGRCKYALIKIIHNNNEIYIVRSLKSAKYHYECTLQVQEQVERIGGEMKILGGGRILYDSKNKKIDIFGHSMQFGLADHQITSNEIKKVYPDYTVTWSNEGY